MKNIFPISLLCAAMLLSTSCSEEVEYQQEQYKSVAYMKNSGIIDIKFYNTGDNVVYNTGVGRGGTAPERTGKIRVEPFTLEEMEAYNQNYTLNYVQIPKECYELSATEFTFEPGQEYAALTVTLKPGVGELPELPEGEYVLPLYLKSDNFAVNASYRHIILHPEVVTPLVSFSMDTDMYTVETIKGNALEETSFSFPMFFDYGANTKDFEVYFQNEEQGLQELVDAYNENNGTVLDLLPATAYSFAEKVSFTGGATMGELLVKLQSIGVNGLDYGEYLLPIQMTRCGLAPFDVNTEDIRYLKVTVVENYKLLELGTDAITGRNDAITQKAINLFDNNLETFYQAQANDDSKDFNNMDCVYFDIDLQDKYDGVRLSYICNYNGNCGILNKIEVYASNDKNEWTKIGDNYDFLDKMQQTTTSQDFTTLPGMKFGEVFPEGAQYIKVCLMDYRWQRSNGTYTIYPITNGTLSMVVNELKVYGYKKEVANK